MQVRARKVGRLVRRMRELLPYLTEQDVPCCRGWAEAELIGAALFAAIMRNGPTYTPEGSTDIAARRVVNDWRQLKMLQLSYERELGLTPAARATLRSASKGDNDFDLVAAMARHIEGAAAEPVAGADESPSDDAPAEQAPSSEQDDPQT